MKIIKVEEWEQNHINTLTLNLILSATIATLIATLIYVVLRGVNMPPIMAELMFAPWSIALVIGTAVAFHRCVLAERARAAAPKEK